MKIIRYDEKDGLRIGIEDVENSLRELSNVARAAVVLALLLFWLYTDGAEISFVYNAF